MTHIHEGDNELRPDGSTRCRICGAAMDVDLAHRQFVLARVSSERDRQDRKWGEQNHAPEKWLAILAEEFGEAAKAALEHGDGDEYRGELYHVAAVVVAAVECSLRHRGKP